jgi:hypothetical protein
MPVKVRTSKARNHRITEEAVAAFIARDSQALQRALGLPPYEESPLHAHRAYVPPGASLEPNSWLHSVRQAQRLRRELQAAVKELRRTKRQNGRLATPPAEPAAPAPAGPTATP